MKTYPGTCTCIVPQVNGGAYCVRCGKKLRPDPKPPKKTKEQK